MERSISTTENCNFREKIAEKITAPTMVTRSIAEELEKLKKLLDEGVITKEEYEKLKKKLLQEQ